MQNELSELRSHSEDDFPPWDEERLTLLYPSYRFIYLVMIIGVLNNYRLRSLDLFIHLKLKAGMQARFMEDRYIHMYPAYKHDLHNYNVSAECHVTDDL